MSFFYVEQIGDRFLIIPTKLSIVQIDLYTVIVDVDNETRDLCPILSHVDAGGEKVANV
jgi:hypothetical protein